MSFLEEVTMEQELESLLPSGQNLDLKNTHGIQKSKWGYFSWKHELHQES